MSWAAILERFVCHLSQYGLTWMWNMNFLCECTIIIPRIPCLIKMANAVSWTVQLVNSVTFDSVNSSHFAMWAFASKCFPIEVVSCFDGWWRTWLQTMHMIPELPVSSIVQCKLNRHEDTCVESFQEIYHFEHRFSEANQASKMICKVRSLKSRIRPHSFWKRSSTPAMRYLKILNPTWR